MCSLVGGPDTKRRRGVMSCGEHVRVMGDVLSPAWGLEGFLEEVIDRPLTHVLGDKEPGKARAAGEEVSAGEKHLEGAGPGG